MQPRLGAAVVGVAVVGRLVGGFDDGAAVEGRLEGDAVVGRSEGAADGAFDGA